ncbi:FadR/GntR family transcriptional regulator [Pseudonocardia asaccharolytica]|uniref:GntR family transcriptional regulator n=1 Tax=Pseudonocardia asaccharolytica DSM 44247 = NBRC 16224 TaxID=1123024 RepID=A0A511D888_9PSEU|nr:GntR family transcriptional regulator [Pseudonocardia asaccharolytica]GEL20633.1 GntR family transcriptional regulator [Pseudonocardia asaccharolytica DSM 44247 = NBRC 16224]
MTTFKPARQTRLYQDVAAQLREAILSGRFAPGDRLPTERELMSEFGVSRAVVRQATMNLEHEGLVEVQVGAGGGTFVLEPGIDAVCRAFENLFRHRGVELPDYLAAKRVLEPALSAAILANSGPDLHQRLQDNLHRFRTGIQTGLDDHEMLRLSLEFHELLVQATGNPVLEALIISLVRMGERVPAFTMSTRADWPHILREHEQLLEALRRRSRTRFSRLMLAHLDTVEEIYDDTPQMPAS